MPSEMNKGLIGSRLGQVKNFGDLLNFLYDLGTSREMQEQMEGQSNFIIVYKVYIIVI